MEIFGVSTTNQINYEPLEASVSLPIDKHLLKAREMGKLYDFINDRTVEKCNVNAFAFIQNYKNNVCDYL